MTTIDTERREFADNEGAFAEWQASRIWCARFATAGLDHAGAEGDGTEAGYAYDAGCWIVDRGPMAADGQFWTIAGCAEETSDDLADVERFLWDNHAQYEVER